MVEGSVNPMKKELGVRKLSGAHWRKILSSQNIK